MCARFGRALPAGRFALWGMMSINHIADLKPDRANRRKHNPRNIGMIADALQEIGAARSIVIDDEGNILAGNGTVEAAAQAGIERVRVVDADGEEIIAVRRSGLTDAQKRRLALFDNRAAELAEWDVDQLLADVTEGLDFEGLFTDDELTSLLAAVMSEDAPEADERATLSDRFIVPPFSVLDARQGYWQDRKRHWLAYGIESELGRGDGITWGDSAPMTDPTLNHYRKGRGNYAKGSARTFGTGGPGDMDEQRREWRSDGYSSSTGKDGQAFRLHRHSRAIKDHAWQAAQDARPQARLTWVAGSRPEDALDETSRKILAAQPQSGTSIFDPVLCELAYRWFCPPAGLVLDPFAGGSVRGIMASLLGRDYIGVDLSGRQIAANEEQAQRITPERRPRWIEGDSADVLPALPDDVDFLFSCPPYADLEVYSDDPRDLSTMDYPAFLTTYRAIIAAGLARLRDNRFACFVVGDVRDTKGLYRNFVSDTIAAFHAAGAYLYNEAILVTAVGSLPIRVGKQFSGGRKLGKTHQNVLVFVKGNAKAAAQACGPVEVELPEPAEEGL